MTSGIKLVFGIAGLAVLLLVVFSMLGRDAPASSAPAVTSPTRSGVATLQPTPQGYVILFGQGSFNPKPFLVTTPGEYVIDVEIDQRVIDRSAPLTWTATYLPSDGRSPTDGSDVRRGKAGPTKVVLGWAGVWDVSVHFPMMWTVEIFRTGDAPRLAPTPITQR